MSSKGGQSYEPSYPGQLPDRHDMYGQPRYVSYEQQYTYQSPTGRDSHGNPTYD